MDHESADETFPLIPMTMMMANSGAIEMEQASGPPPTTSSEAEDNTHPSSHPLAGFPPSIYRARRLLYVSHAVSQCSEKAWDFCVILFLAALSQYQSILWVSTYSLFSYGVTLLGGSYLGAWLDHSPRLKAAQWCIGLENLSVLIATIACCILLTRVQHDDDDDDDDETTNTASTSSSSLVDNPWDILWLILIHVFGAAANLLNQGFVVAIERDWIVVLSTTSSTSSTSNQDEQQSQQQQEHLEKDASMPRAGTPESASTSQDEHGDKISPLDPLHHTNNATTTTTHTRSAGGADSDVSASSSSLDEMQSQWLNQTNVQLRQIYLTAEVLSPTLAGWIVGQAARGGSSSSSSTSSAAAPDDNQGDGIQIQSKTDFFCDLHGAAVLVGVLCILSLLVEYLCTRSVYYLVPELANRRGSTNHATTTSKYARASTTETQPQSDQEAEDNHMDEDEPEIFHNEEEDASGSIANDHSSTTPDKDQEHHRRDSAWKVYWDQKPIVWAGVSMAFVSANVFTFGGVQTTFLLWKGMPVEQVGLWRGLSSFMGLAGTFVYQFVTKKGVSVAVMGAGSITYLLICLTIACVAFAIPNYHVSVYLLVVGTIMSRLGLWMFDVSVTLLYQQNVKEGIRSMIGGTQQSLSAFFTMMSGGLGLFFRKPEEFWIMGMFAYSCIFIATLLYVFGIIVLDPQRRYRYAHPVE